MKITDLQRASDWDVKDWFEKELKLTDYQRRKLYDNETIRMSPFYFYKKPKKVKVNVLWRLTIIVFPIYLILALAFTPIKWIFTGKWGYGRDFVDNFHSPWVQKLGL